MNVADRLKAYSSLADISRRWTSVMDAKAAFLSALNGGLLVFLWASVKLLDSSAPSLAKGCGLMSTFLALLALMSALWVITPREKLSALVGKKIRWIEEYKPVSFYSYVASAYDNDDFKRLEADLAKWNEGDFAQEALEQHFAISRVIQTKSLWIFRATVLTIGAVFFAGIGLMIKMSS